MNEEGYENGKEGKSQSLRLPGTPLVFCLLNIALGLLGNEKPTGCVATYVWAEETATFDSIWEGALVSLNLISYSMLDDVCIFLRQGSVSSRKPAGLLSCRRVDS